MAESSPKRYKTLQEKETLLVMSHFSFSHGVFRRFVLQAGKNQGLFGKGISLFHTILSFNNHEREDLKTLREKEKML